MPFFLYPLAHHHILNLLITSFLATKIKGDFFCLFANLFLLSQAEKVQ